jgi:hypothetical protein
MRFLTTREGLPHISWGAVIAGVILSLIVYLMPSVLGTAIGASLLRPLSGPVSLRAFGFGSGVWVIVTTVISVFTGAYFAGRCAPVLRWLHGVLAWALMVLIVMYGTASIVGGAVSVVGNVASSGAVADQSGQMANGSGSLTSVSQSAQSSLASAVAEASGPQGQQAADTGARAVARATWFSFAALFVGAIIALGAGGLGSRHQPPFKEAGGSSSADDARLTAGTVAAGTTRVVR